MNLVMAQEKEYLCDGVWLNQKSSPWGALLK
jgi:hypothetical protein